MQCGEYRKAPRHIPNPAPCGALPEQTRPGKSAGDQDKLTLALRRMSEAFGGVRCIEACSQRKIEREHAFVERDPELKSLRVVLRAMSIQLIVRPLRQKVA